MTANNPDPTDPKFYEQYYRLVSKQARAIYKTYKRPGLDYEDVYQETWLLFLKCVENYKEDRAAISSYFYQAVNNERDRILAKAMGKATPFQYAAESELRQRAITQPELVSIMMRARTQAEPLDILIRAEDLERIRGSFSRADLEDSFAITCWARGIARSHVLEKIELSGSTLTHRRTVFMSKYRKVYEPDNASPD